MARAKTRRPAKKTSKRPKLVSGCHKCADGGGRAKGKSVPDITVLLNAERAEFWSRIEKLRQGLAATGVKFTDSAELIREDRER